ncbi:hypothetical protein TNCV_3341701 [Trichonephila clavipes]|nr:hypothetical protein TNCV_3341701 [Trichonephila clavipes]
MERQILRVSAPLYGGSAVVSRCENTPYGILRNSRSLFIQHNLQASESQHQHRFRYNVSPERFKTRLSGFNSGEYVDYYKRYIVAPAVSLYNCAVRYPTTLKS